VLEENFRRAMLLARGDYTVFVTRPVSLAILLSSAALLAVFCAPALKRRTAGTVQAVEVEETD
jgi:putative tricarboxylic transport membrane protein